MPDKVRPFLPSSSIRPFIGWHSKLIVFVLLALVFQFFYLRGYRIGVERHSGISIVMDPETLSDAMKTQLQEVADHLLAIYETLAEMQYLDPLGIKRGPHDIESLRPMYESYGLSKSVIYLYSILPYINPDEAGQIDFFHGGRFVDFRDESQVEQGRDPLFASPQDDSYDGEDGLYMYPWMTPLSELGNHQSVIIYDARKHRIWIVDQEGGSSTDYALDNGSPTVESKNRNDLEVIPSRDATAVLKDINTWYRELKVTPGGGDESGPEWWEDLEKIYAQTGWPDNFNGTAFLILQARTHQAKTIKEHVQWPLEQFENLQLSLQRNDQWTKEVALEHSLARTPDEVWKTRFELISARIQRTRDLKRYKVTKELADRLCPEGICPKVDDIPLWNLERMREAYDEKKASVEGYKNRVNETRDNPEDQKAMFIGLRHALKEEQIYKAALAESEAEATRLRPGETFQSATGHQTLEDALVFHIPEAGAAELREFLVSSETQLQELQSLKEVAPSIGKEALEKVSNAIARLEDAIKRERDILASADVK